MNYSVVNMFISMEQLGRRHPVSITQSLLPGDGHLPGSIPFMKSGDYFWAN